MNQDTRFGAMIYRLCPRGFDGTLWLRVKIDGTVQDLNPLCLLEIASG